MDVVDHLREAHRHLSLAVAKFPHSPPKFYVPGWSEWYRKTVRTMLRVDSLTNRLERYRDRSKK